MRTSPTFPVPSILPLALLAIGFGVQAQTPPCDPPPGTECVPIPDIGVRYIPTHQIPGGIGYATLSVSVSGLPDLVVELRIQSPPGTVAGTVLACSGSEGKTYYGDGMGCAGAVLQDLRDRGFRTIERRWREPGWFSAGSNPRLQSARFIGMLRWIAQTYPQRPLVALGNSGGSGEIAYALTTWGAGAGSQICPETLDAAVLGSGPPFSRIDYSCCGTAHCGWPTSCSAVVPDSVWPPPGPDCCILPEFSFVCDSCWQTTSPETCLLRDASVLFHDQQATTDYPDTRVLMLLGELDTLFAVPQALLYYNAVQSEKAVGFVPNGTHQLFETAPGCGAITRGVLAAAGCDIPASLSADGWGTTQQPSVSVNVHGPANAPYTVCYDTALLPIPTIPSPLGGWQFINFAGTAKIGVLGADGRDSFSLQHPAPATIHLQAHVGTQSAGCLSNTIAVKFQ